MKGVQEGDNMIIHARAYNPSRVLSSGREAWEYSKVTSEAKTLLELNIYEDDREVYRRDYVLFADLMRALMKEVTYE